MTGDEREFEMQKREKKAERDRSDLKKELAYVLINNIDKLPQVGNDSKLDYTVSTAKSVATGVMGLGGNVKGIIQFYTGDGNNV